MLTCDTVRRQTWVDLFDASAKGRATKDLIEEFFAEAFRYKILPLFERIINLPAIKDRATPNLIGAIPVYTSFPRVHIYVFPQLRYFASLFCIRRPSTHTASKLLPKMDFKRTLHWLKMQ